MPMDSRIELANRALLDGNRSEVIALLRDHATSGAALWLLAAAIDDDDERLLLLRRVAASGEQPYTALAEDILRREAGFAEALQRGPGWQRWLSDHRAVIIRVLLALLVVGIILLVLALIFP